MPEAPVLLFDGVCSLCHGSVRFVLNHERGPEVRFASLQSDVGRELLVAHGLDPDVLDSLVFIVDDAAFVKSEAVLRLTRFLRPPWSWFRVFRILPRFLRDWMYDRVAANRYRIFGKKDACELPRESRVTPDRFLERA